MKPLQKKCLRYCRISINLSGKTNMERQRGWHLRKFRGMRVLETLRTSNVTDLL